MIDQNLSVLMVDDDRVDQMAFTRMVATSGLPYNYRIAGSAAEGRRLLADERFDVIIADYYLGDGTAFDLFSAGLAKTGAPMIVITGAGSEEMAVQAMQAGAYDYVIKDRAGNYLKSLPTRVEQAVTRWRARTDLEHNQARFQALIENSEDGVWLLDASGGIQYASPSIQRLLGYRVEDFVGRNILDLVHPASMENVMSAMQALASQPQKMIRGEYQWRHADGTWRWLEGTAKNMLTEPGVQALVVNYRDVSEQKRLEAVYLKTNTALATQLDERSAQFEAVSDELEALTYSVAHDLRAPLRSIYAFSTILLEDYPGKLDPAGEGYLKRVAASAGGLSQQIDALIDLARYWRAELRRERVELGEMAHIIMADLREAQPGRHVEFINHHALIANGDSQLLRVALGHLLHNAWKFTSQRPLAQIEFGQVQQDGRPVYFVRDNGAGFDMAYAGNLFSTFQRLHTLAEFPGLGVGLAAVQRIVRRHGGQVWAEAALDQGATFFFSLEPAP